MSQPTDPWSHGDRPGPYGYGGPGQPAYPAYSDHPYGRGYPPSAYDDEPPPPPHRKRWPWLAGAVAAVVIVGLAVYGGMMLGGGGVGTDAAGGAAPTTTMFAGRQVRAPHSAVATSQAPSRSAAPSSQASRGDALPVNGVLKVGQDIPPGEYAITPVGAAGGYWARLSCTTGDLDCILANDNVTGKGYLTVLAGDVAVKVRNLRLVATGDEPAATPADAPTAPGAPPSGTPPSGAAGIDGQGFVGRPAARCNAGNPAVTIARTAHSLVVVCETGVGRYYYKGVRLKDGASIEIDDPVPSGSGFTATNNGVRYTISSSDLVITDGARQLADEPVVQYWSE